MELDHKRAKKSAYYRIDLALDAQLLGSESVQDNEISTLITTTVKFFLFQRNQIPVPFDQISRAPIPDSLPHFHQKEPGDEQDPETEDDMFSSGRERILYLRKRRREKDTEKKLSHKRRKQMHDEKRIHECWDAVFYILQTVLRLHAQNVIGFLLMFGQTVRNPRETILFQFNQGVLHSCTPDGPQKQAEPPGSISSAIRKIFKNIIMSPEFPEFTSKPLQKTNSHICILTKAPIPESSKIHSNLVELNEFVLPGSKHVGHFSKPVLHVNFTINGNVPASEFEFDLFNNNSFSCYQIPIQFRGIQWRKN